MAGPLGGGKQDLQISSNAGCFLLSVTQDWRCNQEDLAASLPQVLLSKSRCLLCAVCASTHQRWLLLSADKIINCQVDTGAVRSQCTSAASRQTQLDSGVLFGAGDRVHTHKSFIK